MSAVPYSLDRRHAATGKMNRFNKHERALQSLAWELAESGVDPMRLAPRTSHDKRRRPAGHTWQMTAPLPALPRSVSHGASLGSTGRHFGLSAPDAVFMSGGNGGNLRDVELRLNELLGSGGGSSQQPSRVHALAALEALRSLARLPTAHGAVLGRLANELRRAILLCHDEQGEGEPSLPPVVLPAPSSADPASAPGLRPGLHRAR